MQESQLPTFERPTEWVNYGDVNPEPHGGLFVRWDGDGWDMVRTYPAVEVIADYDGPETDQWVEQMYVDVSDVWQNGDPDNGVTQQMEQRINELAEPRISPRAPAFREHIGRYVALLERDVESDAGVEDMSDFEDYEDMMASYGVDDWE